ncbi:hypothetical protein ACLOJK_035943 [Asimina triloba]
MCMICTMWMRHECDQIRATCRYCTGTEDFRGISQQVRHRHVNLTWQCYPLTAPMMDDPYPISAGFLEAAAIERICTTIYEFGLLTEGQPWLLAHVSVDLKKQLWERNQPLHNRWHPHIPAVADVRVEEVFRIEMADFTGGCVADNDSAQDIKTIDLSTVSMLLLTKTNENQS